MVIPAYKPPQSGLGKKRRKLKPATLFHHPAHGTEESLGQVFPNTVSGLTFKPKALSYNLEGLSPL